MTHERGLPTFELPGEAADRRALVLELRRRVRSALAGEVSPDGFNIGLNEGEAAGQTVSHPHIHIIPRFDGDVPDPRGGMRWVIPDKAPYWER